RDPAPGGHLHARRLGDARPERVRLRGLPPRLRERPRQAGRLRRDHHADGLILRAHRVGRDRRGRQGDDARRRPRLDPVPGHRLLHDAAPPRPRPAGPMNPAEDHIRHVRHELRTNGGSPSPVGFAPPAVIALDDVWLAFDHPVLQGVTLAVYEGETLVVFGESGSGKSTILKLILRLLVPDRGSIHVFGRDIVRMSYEEAAKIRRRIGMVFQYAALFDSLTVYENVAYPLREHGHRSEAEIEHTVRRSEARRGGKECGTRW